MTIDHSAHVLFKRLSVLMLATTLLLVDGCVQLDQQRVSFRYDAKTDTLHAIIFYDGVHDSGNNSSGKGEDQLPNFVASGDIMIVDWFMHFKMDGVKRAATDGKLPEGQRKLALLILQSLTTQPIGHYRDSQGRMGAAQRVTIKNASKVLDGVNQLISETILKSGDPPDSAEAPIRGTAKRVIAAAKNGHKWLAFDGNAITFTFPVHRQEWAIAKSMGFREFMRDFARREDKEKREKDLNILTQLLTAAPISVIERDGKVTLRLGDPDHANTLRVSIREAYQPNLEATLRGSVPTDMDKTLALDAIGSLEGKAPAGVSDVADWGPVEQKVAAVWRMAQSDDKKHADAAFAWLEQFSRTWKEQDNAPAIIWPRGANDAGRKPFLDGVKQWLDTMSRYPNVETKKAGGEKVGNDNAGPEDVELDVDELEPAPDR